jgi:4-hydroxybenzoate polyprenyltransferase
MSDTSIEQPITEPPTGELTATVPAASAPMRWPLLKLLRPKQWIKNGFVLAPLVFAGVFTQPAMIGRALAATMLFCLAASLVYILNDLCDLDKDRAHPKKRLSRPLAAGAVTPAQAKAVMAALAVALLAGFALSPLVMAGIGAYLAINVAYSFKLKHQPVVDLFCVASGFVLRIAVGAFVLPVPLTSWMLITTLCLALYLATIKRRQELIASGDAGRAVLGRYTVALLDRYAEMSAVGAIVFYSLFTMTVKPELAYTVPCVLFGLFRYWFLVENGDGESPTDVVWTDIPLGLTVVVWGVLCLMAVWQ